MLLHFASKCAIFLLLLAVTGTSGVSYEVRGHIDIISSFDIDPEYYDESSFAEKNEKVIERMSEVIGPDFKDFVIHDYKIHGTDTAVFYAQLVLQESATTTRQDIIDRVQKTDDVLIYFLRQNAVETTQFQRYAVVRDDVTSCFNGGILLPNATCSCSPYNYGAHCGQTICKNNGIADKGRCACPPGIYSNHCEARKCVASVSSTVDFSTQSFIFVLNARVSMAMDLQQIIGNVQILINDYKNQNIPLANYILTIYVQSKSTYIMDTKYETSADSFISDLQSIVIVPTTGDQPTVDALYAAQSSVPQMRPKSIVYLFADSENLDAPTPSTLLSNANESLVIQQTLAWKNKIVIVLSQLPSAPLEPFQDHFDTLRRIVTATHGDLIIADKMEIKELITHTLYYFIGGQNTFLQYYNNQTKSIPILSDTDTGNTFILITCENNASLPNVQDKSGRVLTPTSVGSRFALYTTQKSVSDTISIVGDSVPLHNIRVWFTSFDDVLISYSNDPTVDNDHAYTFSAFDQIPALYSSFAGTTSITVSRMDPTNSKIIQPAAAAEARDSTSSCTFNFQLDTVGSCTPGPYVHNVQISTAKGNFYRVSPGYCFTPDSHSAAPFSCLNNGTRSGVATCNCAANWNGLHCEVPVCQNGGTPDKFPNGGGHGNCICPFGVTGTFCEILTCNVTSPDTFESYNRSFAIIVESSLSAAQSMARLTDGLQMMLNQGQSTDFEEFILTTYKNRQVGDSTVPAVMTERFSSASAFINSTDAQSIGYSYSPAGSQPVMLALDRTLSSMTYDKSSIFLFTDLTEDTYDFDLVNTIVNRQIEISIIVVPPFGQVAMCSDTAGFEKYDILAKQTGGNFINLCQPFTTSEDPVFNFIASYGRSHHHTEVISYYSVRDCSNFVSSTFAVSDKNNDVYVVVYSPTIQNFTAVITDSGTGEQQKLVADAISVPFFASYQVKISQTSGLSYTVNIQSAKNEQCFVRVTERSQFSAYVGFSPDPSVDRYSKELVYATHQTPVIHLSSTLQSEPLISVIIYDDNGIPTYTSNGVKRTSGCKYEYLLKDPMVCNSAEASFTMQTTIRTNEVTIMRTQRALCDNLYVCLNGGLFIGGSCQCLPGYTLQHCEWPTCQNGGKVVDFKCQCPQNYDGDLCQYLKCDDWNFVETHDPRQASFQQLTFVVEIGTRNMILPNSYLQKNIEAFFDSTEDSQTPKQYTLVTFDDTNVNVVVSSAHRDIFLTAFQNAMRDGIGNNQPTKVRSLPALVTAFDTTLDLPGVVYLFTSTDIAKEKIVEANRQRFGVQVNVIYLGADVSTLLPGNISPYLVAPARQTNGRIILMNTLLTPQILTALPLTLGENQLVLDDGVADCTKSPQFSFPIGRKASQVAIDVSGAGVSLTVTDEKSNSVDVKGSTIFSDTNVLMTLINASTHSPGMWTATVKGSGSCFIQVRSVTGLQIIPGFTSSLTNDFTSPTPRVGAGATAASSISFRIIDSHSSDSSNYGSTVDSVEAYATDLESPWSTNTFLGNNTVLARDPLECASQFVTNLITWTSTYEKFIVRGKDDGTNAYQRTFFFTKNAAQTDCQNGAGIDQYGFCQCNSNYYGNLCQLRRCQNGGISAYGLCDCPNGYYGDFCEKYIPLPGL